jgi:hypothetical protein
MEFPARREKVSERTNGETEIEGRIRSRAVFMDSRVSIGSGFVDSDGLGLRGKSPGEVTGGMLELKLRPPKGRDSSANC